VPTPAPALDQESLFADLRWLIMEGYVVEFSDGRLWALEDKPAAPAPVEPAPVASATNDPSRVSQPLAGAEPAAPTPSANLAHKIGIIHYNLDGFSFPQFLQFAAEAGCQSVELQLADVWGNGVDDPEKNAERLNKEIAAHGLSVSALAAHNDFVQLEEATIDSQVERMKRICGLGRILNPEAVIRAEGGAPKENVPKEKWLEAMRGCFSRCMEFLDDMKMSLAIDNHGLITNDGDLLHTLLEQLNCKRIGTNLDTMNYRWFGHDIATCNRFYELMAPHALHTHIKDGFGSRENYRGAALGEGEIDLSYALRCLEKAGYQGVYCAEYEGPELLDGAGYRKCCQWLARTRNR
jgi:sugar phosphate isomerase/epimerase